jgi:Family of unknown function (DUF5996)
VPGDGGPERWPELPLDAWQDTCATLHRWMQMVGKTRLALAPMQNHWWQVALYLTARGLTTSPMPAGRRTLELEFDFLSHELVARTSGGARRTLPLKPQSVAAFYASYRALLNELDVHVTLLPRPVETADATPFPQDEVHAAYDAEAAQRCWRVLLQVERVLQVFRGRFVGKCSPVHFWWGSFDLAHTRFNGRPAPRHPGGIPNLADWVTREAYSHECISVGWWPGGNGAPVREPAFYAYVYPEPPGCPEAAVRPAAASYHAGLREWILPYEAVRRSADPDAALLEFAQSTYDAAAGLAGWDRAAVERSV